MVPNGPRSPIAPDALDRLVDGSLAADERRALLSRLDDEPGAWRRCALSFLEAQAWRESFGPLAHPDEAASPPAAPRPTWRARLRLAPIGLAAGLAASAFLLGRTTGRPASPGGELAAVARAPDAGAPRPSGVDAADSPPTDPLGDPATEPGDAADPSPWWAGVQAVGYLSLPSGDGPGAPALEVPVLAGPGLDDHWLRDQPSFIPEQIRTDWERLGYAVESQRRLVSVQLDDDGRYLTIPVDEVILRANDRQTY